jgi:hypothetical protein
MHPVVVGATASLAHGRVGDIPDVEPRGGVDALARDAVLPHDGKATIDVRRQCAQRIEVGNARLTRGIHDGLGLRGVLDTDSHRELRCRGDIGAELRRKSLLHRGRQVLAPEPTRLFDVAIGRNQGE